MTELQLRRISFDMLDPLPPEEKAMHTSHPFAHRTNPDGTVDSICKKCFATVCAQCESQDLCRANEAKHICEPWKLEVVNVVLSKTQDGGG